MATAIYWASTIRAGRLGPSSQPKCRIHQKNCGSEPARDDGLTVNLDVEYSGLIASRLAPTGSMIGAFFIAGLPIKRRSTT
ncbi:hypothetical protein EJA72_17460 [Pseudomonas sp. PB120]|nr:hypothetical protein [Pseudomonas sp. PB120]